MSPRLPSAITSSPRSRANALTRSAAASPWCPACSKNASCGLTATACSPAASTMPVQKRSIARASPAGPSRTPRKSSSGNSSGRGSSPMHSTLLRSAASRSRRSRKLLATVVRLSPGSASQIPRPRTAFKSGGALPSKPVLRHATAASSSARGWRPGGSGSRTGTRPRAAATRLSASASGAVQATGTTPGARPAKACASSSASE